MGFSTSEVIEILGAALLVNVVTLMCVAVLAPVFPVKGKFRDGLEGVIVSFAAGAIFGSAFLLLLLQSAVFLLLSTFDEPFGAIWRWASLVMAGYLTKGFTHIVISLIVCNSVNELKNPTVTFAPLVPSLPAGSSKESVVTPAHRARVAGGLLLGDVTHKLLNGLIIASMFSNCNPRVGWAITFSMVIKEVAHDISDYFLLVANSGAGFKPAMALLVKFCFGMAIVLGTVPILVLEPSQRQTGLILSYAAGVYIHVAATEYMPRAYSLVQETPLLRLGCMLAFMAGATCVGMVLIDMKNCAQEALFDRLGQQVYEQTQAATQAIAQAAAAAAAAAAAKARAAAAAAAAAAANATGQPGSGE